jgi:NADPH-dependent curcumin reductase CurA
VVLVTAAGGAVGHVVGQLAKLKGCTVIGIVGTDQKLEWCKNELGFDHVFNYKKCDFSEEISKVAPEGIDIYYDNVN